MYQCPRWPLTADLCTEGVIDDKGYKMVQYEGTLEGYFLFIGLTLLHLVIQEYMLTLALPSYGSPIHQGHVMEHSEAQERFL